MGSSPSAPTKFQISGCSVVRLSRLVWDQEIAGSNPAIPTTLWGHSSVWPEHLPCTQRVVSSNLTGSTKIRSGFKTGNRPLRLCLWYNREPKNSLIQFLNRIRERKVRNPSKCDSSSVRLEHYLAKVRVVSSNLICRSKFYSYISYISSNKTQRI